MLAASQKVCDIAHQGDTLTGGWTLKSNGVTDPAHLTMPVLAGTPAFGWTSLEYLTLALADEVLRLRKLIVAANANL
jgi:hypothetical protein